MLCVMQCPLCAPKGRPRSESSATDLPSRRSTDSETGSGLGRGWMRRSATNQVALTVIKAARASASALPRSITIRGPLRLRRRTLVTSHPATQMRQLTARQRMPSNSRRRSQLGPRPCRCHRDESPPPYLPVRSAHARANGPRAVQCPYRQQKTPRSRMRRPATGRSVLSVRRAGVIFVGDP